MQTPRLQPTGNRHSYKLPQPRQVLPATCPNPFFRPGAQGRAPGPGQAQPRPVPQAQRQSGCPEAAKPMVDLVPSSRRLSVTTLCKGALNAMAACTSTALEFVSHTIRQRSRTLRASVLCQAASGNQASSGHGESATPIESGSAEGDSKATVREQLNKLNQEADELAAEIKKTFDGLLGAPDNELFKMRYTDLKAKEDRLDEMRKALQAQLTGRQRPRVKLADTAAKLVQHKDDPTMYTVQYPGGRETLFHDPTDLVGQLRHYLREKVQPEWCSFNAAREILPLYISGAIKSGKTFLMNVILPAVMAEMAAFTDTSTLQIDASVINRKGGYDALCKSLLGQVIERAAEKRIVTQALEEASMERAEASLMRIFQNMDVPLAIQMDEVQHLLSPRQRSGRVDKDVQQLVAQLLKTLWCYSSRHCQWTVTGSGMALFWILLGVMPVNGISPLNHRVTVHLPHEHKKEAKTQVLQHLLAADGKPYPPGTLPSGYELLRDYAENCAMLAFAYNDYDTVQPMHQHLAQLDRDKLTTESVAEWRDIVLFEFDMGRRRALAGLYNTLDGCDLSQLRSPGLAEMLSTLTTPVEDDPKRVYFTSHFHRAGLALCVTLDGKVVDPFSGLAADRRLHLGGYTVTPSSRCR